MLYLRAHCTLVLCRGPLRGSSQPHLALGPQWPRAWGCRSYCSAGGGSATALVRFESDLWSGIVGSVVICGDLW